MSQLKNISHGGLEVWCRLGRSQTGSGMVKRCSKLHRDPAGPQWLIDLLHRKWVLSATNYRPRGWFTHTPVHTCMQKCTLTHADDQHTQFVSVKQVGLSFSPLSLLPVVCSHPERGKEHGEHVDLLTLPFSHSVFNLSFLFVVVIRFLPQSKWLKRHRITTSGPQEDILTPPTNSHSLCLSLAVSTTCSLVVGSCRRACCQRQFNKTALDDSQWEWFWKQKCIWMESVVIDSPVHLLVKYWMRGY